MSSVKLAFCRSWYRDMNPAPTNLIFGGLTTKPLRLVARVWDLALELQDLFMHDVYKIDDLLNWYLFFTVD